MKLTYTAFEPFVHIMASLYTEERYSDALKSSVSLFSGSGYIHIPQEM